MRLNTLHEGKLSQMLGGLTAAAGIALTPGLASAASPEAAPKAVQGAASMSGIDYKSMIREHEGVRDTVYVDSRGNPTVGVGFNLNRPGAKEELKAVGADYRAVLNGQPLTRDQIEKLFDKDVRKAVSAASRVIPGFEAQPTLVKKIVVDMAFNLGEHGLRGFKKMREALQRKDYNEAANEMVDSKWYDQVGDRSKKLVEMMRSLAR